MPNRSDHALNLDIFWCWSLPSPLRQFLKNVMFHNFLWVRVMSVKVSIFGKEITRKIYLWPRIVPWKLRFWENHKKLSFLAPNYFVHPLYILFVTTNCQQIVYINLATVFHFFKLGSNLGEKVISPPPTCHNFALFYF